MHACSCFFIDIANMIVMVSILILQDFLTNKTVYAFLKANSETHTLIMVVVVGCTPEFMLCYIAL